MDWPTLGTRVSSTANTTSRLSKSAPNDNEMAFGLMETTVRMNERATSFLVQRSPIVGRCLVASKDLSQGELVVRERPIGKLIHIPLI